MLLPSVPAGLRVLLGVFGTIYLRSTQWGLLVPTWMVLLVFSKFAVDVQSGTCSGEEPCGSGPIIDFSVA